jgi:ABC-type sugar transport system ATPase subunit
MSALVTVRNLRVSRGRTEILRDVNLELRDGDVTAVLGPNGAGKSTLVAALSGLVKPDGGDIRLEGRVASALQSAGMARRSVRANVELALAWWGVPARDRRPRAAAALEDLNVGHLVRRRATELSGGEQRRVHLARSLALDADILLLDEPFAGLDPAARGALLDDASSVLRDRRGTTLVVVHDRAEAWALADNVVVLLDGRVAAAGPTRDVLENPPDASVARFLGYDGQIDRGDRMVLTRAGHIVVDPAGDEAVITRVVAGEDGCRVRLELADGAVWAKLPAGAAVGDRLRVRVVGGANFPREQ